MSVKTRGVFCFLREKKINVHQLWTRFIPFWDKAHNHKAFISFIHDNTFPVSPFFRDPNVTRTFLHLPTLWSLCGILMNSVHCSSPVLYILWKEISEISELIWLTKILRHDGMRKWSFLSNLICKNFREVNSFSRAVFLYLHEAKTCLLCELIELSRSSSPIICLYLR